MSLTRGTASFSLLRRGARTALEEMVLVADGDRTLTPERWFTSPLLRARFVNSATTSS